MVLFNKNSILLTAAMGILLATSTVAYADRGDSDGDDDLETQMFQAQFAFPAHILGDAIPNSEAELERGDDSFAMEIKTSELVPGDAVSAWWMIWNHPENCAQEVCDLIDAFFNPAVGFSLVNGRGAIVDEDGTAVFRSTVDVDSTNPSVPFPEAILINDTLHSQFDPGLLNPEGAQVWFNLKTHGPASEDPQMLEEQLTTLSGGCASPFVLPCKDIQQGRFPRP